MQAITVLLYNDTVEVTRAKAPCLAHQAANVFLLLCHYNDTALLRRSVSKE